MPKPGPRTTYKYSEEFKAKAVQLSHLEGVQVKEVVNGWVSAISRYLDLAGSISGQQTRLNWCLPRYA